ncbi:CPBP family intramembrane glutamic endopeptidase [Butyrivibrio proteoclasticus]|uniref:CPBP family intramembrane glutamic endopeptidase n=1 Tax=Butyrivibrio proteoclasticus TaxID=43305 RepID=UPI00047EBB25|nr:CPBP family intramembrane glutamic endopeptidase [Butyrivibrio proteoclasticus]
MKTTKGSKVKAVFAGLGIVMLLLGVQMVIGMIFGVAATLKYTDQAEILNYVSEKASAITFWGEVACIVVFGLWYYLGYVRKDKKLGTYESGLKKVANVKSIAFLTFAALGCYGLVLILVKAITVLIPGSMELYSQIMGAATGGNPVLAIIAVVLLAPAAEELALRGLMLKSSKKAFGIVGCVVLSGLMFGLMHMNPMQSLYTIPMGLLLGFVAYKYNSVIPAIIMHFINNAASCFIPAFLGRAVNVIEATIIFVVFSALAVIVYKKFFAKTEQTETPEVAA